MASSFFATQNDIRQLFFSIAISLVCHAIVFAVFIYSPIRLSERRVNSHVINVDLVSLPSLPEASKSRSKQSSNEKQQKTIKVPQTKPKTDLAKPVKKSSEKIIVPSKKKVKKSLKKQTYKSSKVKKSAIKRLEKDIDKTRPDPLSKALDRLRNTVEHESPGTSHEGTATNGMIGQQIASELEIYKAVISHHINKNWTFSEQMAGNVKGKEAVLVIKIMKNGEISDIRFEKKSGNRHLDESGYKALKKSDPLPALPNGVASPYELGFRFTQSGLR